MERKILNIKEILKSTNYKRNCFLFSIFFFAGILACTVCLTSGLSYEITWESILGTSIFTLVFGFLFIWFFGLKNILSILKDVKPIKNKDFVIYEDILVGKTKNHVRDSTYYELVFDGFTFKTGESITVEFVEYKYSKIGEPYYIVSSKNGKSNLAFPKSKYELDAELYPLVRVINSENNF